MKNPAHRGRQRAGLTRMPHGPSQQAPVRMSSTSDRGRSSSLPSRGGGHVGLRHRSESPVKTTQPPVAPTPDPAATPVPERRRILRILAPGTQPTQSSGSGQTENTEGQPSARAPAEKAMPEPKPPATYARAVAPTPNATPPVPLSVSEWPPLGNPKSQQNAQATATAPVTAPVVETTSANQEETSCAAAPEEHDLEKRQAEQTCGVAIGRPPLVPAMKHGAGKRKAGQQKQKGAAPAPALETSRSKKDRIGRVNSQTIESATEEQTPNKKQETAQPQAVEPTTTTPSPERIPANMDASKETGLVSGSASNTRCVRLENLHGQALQAASVTPERPLAKHEIIRREVVQTYEAIEHQKRLAAQEIMRNVTARAWKTDSFVEPAPPNQENLAIRRKMLDRLTRPAPAAAKSQEVILDRFEYFLRMFTECNVGIFRLQMPYPKIDLTGKDAFGPQEKYPQNGRWTNPFCDPIWLYRDSDSEGKPTFSAKLTSDENWDRFRAPMKQYFSITRKMYGRPRAFNIPNKESAPNPAPEAPETHCAPATVSDSREVPAPSTRQPPQTPNAYQNTDQRQLPNLIPPPGREREELRQRAQELAQQREYEELLQQEERLRLLKNEEERLRSLRNDSRLFAYDSRIYSNAVRGDEQLHFNEARNFSSQNPNGMHNLNHDQRLYHGRSHPIPQRSFNGDLRMHQDDPRSYYQDPRLHQNDPRYFNNDSGLYQNDPRAFADDSRVYQGNSHFYTNGNQQQWEEPRQPRNAYMPYPPGLNVPMQYPPGLNVPMQRPPGLNVLLQYPPGLNPMRGPMNQF
ncbi:hypothetical protein HDU96_009169 [Phlyctochytrium bullatum]|nr:hypothetical protein HDU96_009169 [Phlyctochytrium bullatum]